MIRNNEYKLMKRYVEGRMTSVERAGFEATMSKDAFLADAVEGFKSDPGAFADMPALTNSSLSWLYIMIAGAIAILFTYMPSNSPTPNDVVIYNPTLFPIGNVIQEHFSAEHEPLTVEAVQETDLESFTLAETSEALEPIKVEIEPVVIEELVSPSPVFLEAFMRPIQASEIEAHANKEIQDNTDIIYIQDFKIVSFSQAKTAVHFKNEQYENHLPAAFEDSAPPTSPLQARLAQRLTKINYSDKLEQALIAIGNAEYAKASKLIDQLNRDFGQTVNHNFYLGLCAYHLGDYYTSNQIFKSVEADIIQSFRQEAMWYRALSLQKLELNVEALEIFEEIYEANGHYAPMAASRMVVLRE